MREIAETFAWSFSVWIVAFSDSFSTAQSCKEQHAKNYRVGLDQVSK